MQIFLSSCWGSCGGGLVVDVWWPSSVPPACEFIIGLDNGSRGFDQKMLDSLAGLLLNQITFMSGNLSECAVSSPSGVLGLVLLYSVGVVFCNVSAHNVLSLFGTSRSQG